jgi:mono/diheme cytochrome c family protein
MKNVILPLLALGLLGLVACTQPAEEPASTPSNMNDVKSESPGGETAAVTYEKDIKSILDKSCVSCHAGDAAADGVKLTTLDEIKASGHIDDLVPSVKGEGKKRMPPTGAPLPAEEIAMVEKWVAAGTP